MPKLPPWLSLRRPPLSPMSLYFIGRTLSGGVGFFVDAALGRLERRRSDRYLQRWARALVLGSRTSLDVRGAADVDWGRSYIVMSNHRSHFDIPVVFVAVPASVRMVTKAELYRVPIFGGVLRHSEMVRVDRRDHAQAMRSLREAKRLIESGINVWIAPEGTRSRDGRLGPFKKGGFVLAAETGVPILPAYIEGTERVIPPDSLVASSGHAVRVRFGQPLATAGRSVDELIAEVRGWLEAEAARAEA